jgi:hypothetical protein
MVQYIDTVRIYNFYLKIVSALCHNKIQRNTMYRLNMAAVFAQGGNIWREMKYLYLRRFEITKQILYKNSPTPDALGFKCIKKYIVCFCLRTREISIGIETGLHAEISVNRGSIPDGC